MTVNASSLPVTPPSERDGNIDGVFSVLLAGSFLLGVTSNLHAARYHHSIRRINLSGKW